MIQRNIFENEIEDVINNPTETIYQKEQENYISYGAIVDKITKKEFYLVIAHNDLNSNVVNIITVFVEDKGGLKKRGFKI